MAIADIPFEDCRFKCEEWDKIKPKMPFGAVPVMHVNGEALGQSDAMLRYVGKLGGLYPSDPLEALRVDEVVDTMSATILAAFSYWGPDQGMLQKARDAFVERDIPRYLGTVDGRIKASKKGPFFLGPQVSIADLKITQVFTMLTIGCLEHIDPTVLDRYSSLSSISKAVLNMRAVQKWKSMNNEVIR